MKQLILIFCLLLPLFSIGQKTETYDVSCICEINQIIEKGQPIRYEMIDGLHFDGNRDYTLQIPYTFNVYGRSIRFSDWTGENFTFGFSQLTICGEKPTSMMGLLTYFKSCLSRGNEPPDLCGDVVDPCEGVECEPCFACNPETGLCESICNDGEICNADGVCVPDVTCPDCLVLNTENVTYSDGKLCVMQWGGAISVTYKGDNYTSENNCVELESSPGDACISLIVPDGCEPCDEYCLTFSSPCDDDECAALLRCDTGYVGGCNLLGECECLEVVESETSKDADSEMWEIGVPNTFTYCATNPFVEAAKATFQDKVPECTVPSENNPPNPNTVLVSGNSEYCYTATFTPGENCEVGTVLTNTLCVTWSDGQGNTMESSVELAHESCNTITYNYGVDNNLASGNVVTQFPIIYQQGNNVAGLTQPNLYAANTAKNTWNITVGDCEIGTIEMKAGTATEQVNYFCNTMADMLTQNGYPVVFGDLSVIPDDVMWAQYFYTQSCEKTDILFTAQAESIENEHIILFPFSFISQSIGCECPVTGCN